MNRKEYEELRAEVLDNLETEVELETLEWLTSKEEFLNLSKLYDSLLEFNESVEELFSLRLKEDVLIVSRKRSLDWYRNHYSVRYEFGEYVVDEGNGLRFDCVEGVEEFFVRELMVLPSREEIRSGLVRKYWNNDCLKFNDLEVGDRFRFHLTGMVDNSVKKKVKLGEGVGYLDLDNNSVYPVYGNILVNKMG